MDKVVFLCFLKSGHVLNSSFKDESKTALRRIEDVLRKTD